MSQGVRRIVWLFSMVLGYTCVGSQFDVSASY